MSTIHMAPPVDIKRLEAKTVVVTGAGRGFGEGIARRMAQHGAQVIATALEADELNGVAATIAAEGGSTNTWSELEKLWRICRAPSISISSTAWRPEEKIRSISLLSVP